MSAQQAQKQFSGVLLGLVNDKRRVISIYVLLVLAGGAVYSVAEGKSFWDGIWWAVISSLSIGYGDQYPVTVTGRIDGIFVGIAGIMIIVPLIIGLIIKDVLQDIHQFTDLEQRLLLIRSKILLASVIVVDHNVRAIHKNQDLTAQMLILFAEKLGILGPVQALYDQFEPLIDDSELEGMNLERQIIENEMAALLSK